MSDTLKNFDIEVKKINSWNLTYSQKATIIYPANLKELKKIIKILTKINNCENIIISNNYKESYYSYKLCANADLIIAKHTSIADECLSNEIPVLFHEYTHNMKKLVVVFPNYLSSEFHLGKIKNRRLMIAIFQNESINLRNLISSSPASTLMSSSFAELKYSIFKF